MEIAMVFLLLAAVLFGGIAAACGLLLVGRDRHAAQCRQQEREVSDAMDEDARRSLAMEQGIDNLMSYEVTGGIAGQRTGGL